MRKLDDTRRDDENRNFDRSMFPMKHPNSDIFRNWRLAKSKVWLKVGLESLVIMEEYPPVKACPIRL